MLLIYTYSPKYHVQGHGNIEIECIIIAHISTEEHSNEDGIISVKKERKGLFNDTQYGSVWSCMKCFMTKINSIYAVKLYL
jgi:hypothetical protein